MSLSNEVAALEEALARAREESAPGQAEAELSNLRERCGPEPPKRTDFARASDDFPPLVADPETGEREARYERIAKEFHQAYEELAPIFGYRTREESAKPWKDVPRQNQLLMIATVKALIEEDIIRFNGSAPEPLQETDEREACKRCGGTGTGPPGLAVEAGDKCIRCHGTGFEPLQDGGERDHAFELLLSSYRRENAEVERLREALSDIAGDYGCGLLEPADVSLPAREGEACREQWPDDPGRWCVLCVASAALTPNEEGTGPLPLIETMARLLAPIRKLAAAERDPVEETARGLTEDLDDRDRLLVRAALWTGWFLRRDASDEGGTDGR